MTLSLPAWKRGLKSLARSRRNNANSVASCVEAWIEIFDTTLDDLGDSVASCVEAWIEISVQDAENKKLEVASCVEAWIEISQMALFRQ